MGSNKISRKSTTTCLQLASLLRQFADELEAGSLCLAELELQPHDAVEIQSAIKTKKSKTTWEIKIKGQGILEEALVEAHSIAATSDTKIVSAEIPKAQARRTPKPRYKSVKKRMSKDLKTIKSALRLDESPPADVVSAFLDDCELITTYRGKGDAEEYRLHLEQAEALRTATEANDIQGMLEALAGLKQREKACHAKYK